MESVFVRARRRAGHGRTSLCGVAGGFETDVRLDVHEEVRVL